MEMTVGRALKEIKLLDKRIAKQTENAVFVDAFQKKSKKLWKNSTSKEDFENNAKGSYDSIKDLIKNRNDIKSKILISNATTKVSIGEKEYTVIEAIERKNSIKLEKELLFKMKRDLSEATHYIDQVDAQIKQNIHSMLQQSVSDDRMRSEKDYEVLSKPFKEDNEYKIVDPLGISKKIEKLDEEIDRFLNDVDYALSESNSITKIEV